MTIYASRTPESMNGDPEPWAYRRDALSGVDGPFGHPERAAARVDSAMMHYPRPEFTPKTTHPANPILVSFREREAINGTRDDAVMWLEGCTGVTATPEQINHARRVLTRLANFR